MYLMQCTYLMHAPSDSNEFSCSFHWSPEVYVKRTCPPLPPLQKKNKNKNKNNKNAFQQDVYCPQQWPSCWGLHQAPPWDKTPQDQAPPRPDPPSPAPGTTPPLGPGTPGPGNAPLSTESHTPVKI